MVDFNLAGEWGYGDKSAGVAQLTQEGTCVTLTARLESWHLTYEARGTLAGSKVQLDWQVAGSKDAGTATLEVNPSTNEMKVVEATGRHIWLNTRYQRAPLSRRLEVIRSLLERSERERSSRHGESAEDLWASAYLLFDHFRGNEAYSNKPEVARIGRTLAELQAKLSPRRRSASTAGAWAVSKILLEIARARRNFGEREDAFVVFRAAEIAARGVHNAGFSLAVMKEMGAPSAPTTILHQMANQGADKRFEQLAATCLTLLRAGKVKASEEVCAESGVLQGQRAAGRDERAASSAIFGWEGAFLKNYEAVGESFSVAHLSDQLAALSSIEARTTVSRQEKRNARARIERVVRELSAKMTGSRTLDDLETARQALTVSTDLADMSKMLAITPEGLRAYQSRAGYQALLAAFETAGNSTTSAALRQPQNAELRMLALHLLGLRTARGQEVETSIGYWSRPQLNTVYEGLRRLRGQLADWYFAHGRSASAGRPPDALVARIADAERTLAQSAAAKEEKETRIAPDVQPEDDRRAPERTIERARQALPPGSALVAYQRFNPLDAAGLRQNEPHYAAFLVRADSRQITLVDLGPAAPIEHAIDQFDKSLLAPLSRTVEAEATELYEQLVAPFAARLKGVSVLRIAPDAQLRRLPFAALRSGKQWLIGTFEVSCLASVRELRPVEVASRRPLTVAVFADPAQGQARYVERELQPSSYQSLAGFREEAKVLERVFRGMVSVFLGEEAREGTFLGQTPPTILHVAAHGTFLGSVGQRGNVRGVAPIAQERAPSSSRAERDEVPDSGWLRSILVLFEPTASEAAEHHSAGATAAALDGGCGDAATGACTSDRAASETSRADSGPVALGRNGSDPGRAVPRAAAVGADEPWDGFVSAYEVRTMDLHGTALVVLSACQTALGRNATWFGIYSLAQAFHVAGAVDVVATLWSVDDSATQELMQAFYEEVARGRTHAAALRSAMLFSLLHHPHPYFWAPFILDSGGTVIGARHDGQ